MAGSEQVLSNMNMPVPPSNIPRGDVPNSVRCPHLGTLSSDRRAGEPIEYPSFENRCWSGEQEMPLLLTDQATLCLCAGFRHCPRFVAARAARHGQEQHGQGPQGVVPHQPTSPRTSPLTPRPAIQPAPAAPPADDAISHALGELAAEMNAGEVAETRSRQRWGWIGAGLIFMSSLLCGGLFAAYIGWQMVSSDLLATTPGNVDTLSAAAQEAPQMYIIVTGTSEPAALAPAPQWGELAATPVYPSAVTATPGGQGTQFSAQPAAPAAQNAPQAVVPAATPIFDMQLEIPTRRPTPMLDIPTSTPLAGSPTPSPSPTNSPTAVIVGTPVVVFTARDSLLEPGECTLLMWHVENVRAVFYENTGVDGKGEREECIDNDDNTYSLTVILADGTQQIYTTEVEAILPTETPTPRPTREEEVSPTPTWTPNVPTETPTPTITYQVGLEVGGDSTLTCQRGESCEVDLYVTNASTVLDTIKVYFTDAGAWPRKLCRLDGACGENEMLIVNLGPSNTGVVRVQISLPADTEQSAMTYRLQASSEASGGDIRSDTVTIEVRTADEATTD